MKQKIRIVDNISNKVVEKEVVISDKAHLETQIRYPARVHRDKTKYTRRTKHRNRNDYWFVFLGEGLLALQPFIYISK